MDIRCASETAAVSLLFTELDKELQGSIMLECVSV